MEIETFAEGVQNGALYKCPKCLSKNVFEIYKEVGETPLEALERFRASNSELSDKPMTYAGRLDPLAEGVLIILVGDECKDKEKYLNMDKEYEVEIAFGMSTDTYDALGLINTEKHKIVTGIRNSFSGLEVDLTKYVGKFKQQYPPFSAKTVDGVKLYELAKNGELPDEMPTKEVEIYSIDIINCCAIKSDNLRTRIIQMIDRVKGDFRQFTIKTKWCEVLGLENPDTNSYSKYFEVLKIRVRCSSGTYMRSLAHRIGEDLGIGAFALGIKRTKFL